MKDFPYHYGLEADSYTFYRIPKLLFSEPEFSMLSTDARLLYGLLLDRMQLSVRNNWMDEDGRVYIYYKIESISEALGCGSKKAGNLLAELDDRKGIGLISRVRQGMGRPDRIYVRRCITSDMSERHFMTCQNDTSRAVEMTSHDLSKGQPNKTEKKEKEIKETDHIESYPSDGGDTRRLYRNHFEETLAMDALKHDFTFMKDVLEELVELMIETCTSNRKKIRIGGEERDAEEVKKQFLSLNDSHIRYVLECFRENTTDVRNIRQYLLTALYNAPMTINSYYSAKVQHDMKNYRKGEDR